MIKKIVAIGGGESGRIKELPDGTKFQCPYETKAIDEAIVDLAEKKNPKFLFIGTASKEAEGYFSIIKKNFEALGCDVSDLKLLNIDGSINSNIKIDSIKNQIMDSDIIYVGGGDTRFMLDVWKIFNIDKFLIEAYENGKVLSGISAGAVCWFDYYNNCGYRDEPDWKIGVLPGLGLLRGLCVPHFEEVSDEDRTGLIESLKNMTAPFGVGLENCTAVIFIDEKISKTISTKNGAEVGFF